MTSLTSTQIGLLNLCLNESGPSIEEIYNFSSSYGASQQTLRSDLLILLIELYIQPIGYIDPATYIPTAYLITQKGELCLKKLINENLDAVPSMNLSFFSLTHREERNDVMSLFPRLIDLSNDDIASLAETYLYWALNPPTDRLYISTNSLFYSCAIGFAQINDHRRFAKSVRNCFAALEEKGQFLEVVILSSKLATQYPELEQIILAVASNFLEKPYWNLTAKKMPLIDSQVSLQQFLAEFSNIAIKTGSGYIFKMPHQNHLIGIANRIEDILGKAFDYSSKSLFYDVINLENIFEKLIDSIVERTDATNDFESRSGFSWRIELTTQCCVLLEKFADLVTLPEPSRLQAFKNTLQIIRILHRTIAVPVWSVCQSWDSADDLSGNWIFELIGLNEAHQRAELVGLFKKLNDLRDSIASLHDKVGIATIVDDATMQTSLNYIAQIITRLDEIKADTSLLSNVKLPAIEEQLGILLPLSIESHEFLKKICHMILSTSSLLSHIDTLMNSELPAIKKDLLVMRDFISQSTQIKEVDRTSFSKELGEMLKLSSAAKIIATVPLLPGFIEYKKEISIATDWNKWIEKLASLFKSKN